MDSDKSKEIIALLQNNRFFAECPHCNEQILLKDAGLFYLDNFTSEAKELYQQYLEELKEREMSIKKDRKNITKTSKIGSKAVNLGLVLERLAPSMKSFPFNHNDCRSLFDPIDYIIFNGLSGKGPVDKIIFMDIKTGRSRLKEKQKEIKSLIENKKVTWDTYQREV